MNIIFAVGAYWPNAGGVQMVTQYLAEGLVKRGHTVQIITKLVGTDIREEVHNGVKIIRFLEKDFLKFHYGEKREYQEYIMKQSMLVDVLIVVCSNNFVAQWIYPIMNRIQCCKILYQHGMYDGKLHLEKIHSLRRLVKQTMLTMWWEIYHKRYWNSILKFNACVHLFKNDTSYNYFEKNGFVNNYVITNSCEEIFFEKNKDDNIAEKYGISSPYYIYVANYCPGKNQIKAVQQFVKSRCEKTDLVLIGSQNNNYYNEIKKIIEKIPTNKKKRIHLLYDVSRDDTVELIKNSYTCFITSENEFLPIVILEGMASAKPFISTNVGVVSKIPGGNVCNTDEDIVYWLEYYENHPEYVQQLGNIAEHFARDNCFLDDKIRMLEEICERGL